MNAANKSFNRRQFIGLSTATTLSLLSSGCRLNKTEQSSSNNGEFVFIEAEGFADHGGWGLDQQSMDQMGSPYLLAHGLGIPVADAVTKVSFPTGGTYRLWVRTRDWVAPWKAPGAPGKFQVLIDGQAVKETFGTKNAQWHWHDGGEVTVNKKTTIALHDLTGFEGRCEALLFCKETQFEPTNDVAALTKFRRELLGLPSKPDNGGNFDMVVVGGGLAGTCAALSAARNGIKVALVQDRPVLGGNGSSEVRVWPEGHTGKDPYPHIGDLVEEILPEVQKRGVMNGTAAENFGDSRKIDIIENESNITLLTNHRGVDVETKDNTITAVTIQSTLTQRQQRLTAKFFTDSTGDATIGFLGGADYEYKPENLMGSTNLFNVLDASDKEQVFKCECKDKSALTMKYEKGEYEQPFPRCPWALDLSDKPFPGRVKLSENKNEKFANFANRWFWESGYDKNQVTEIEMIRDHNFRAMYGAWDALKNVDKMYPNHRLGWSAFIAGKRESRRLLGDVILDAEHFRKGVEYKDGAFPCSWAIDLHTPNSHFSKGFEENPFIAIASQELDRAYYTYKGIYWAPYRCLYSRNINNLFMAGRDISVTKTGLGPVRVMKTCGMMGEIVGKAASLCVLHNTTPRGVYENHLEALKALMMLPGGGPERSRSSILINQAGKAIRNGNGEIITALARELKALRSLVMPRDTHDEPGAAFKFKVSSGTVVYISVHQRGGYTPPAGWEKTNLQLVWRDSFKDIVYKKTFPAGIVNIPSHNGKVGDFYGFPHVAFVENKAVEISL